MSSVDTKIVELELEDEDFLDSITTVVNKLANLKEAFESLTGSEDALDNIVDAAEEASGVDFSAVGNAVSSLNDKVSALGVSIGTVISDITSNLTSTLSSAFSSLSEMVFEGGVTRNMNLQQAYFLLEALCDSDEQVEEIMDTVNEAVTDTSASLDEAAVVAANFVAAGQTDTDYIYDALLATIGVASVTSSEFSDIAEIMTDIVVQDQLTGDTLSSLQLKGVSMTSFLAEDLGVTTTEIEDMISDGEISAETAINVLIDRFGESAKEANRTVTGVTANIESALARIGAMFTDTLLENDGVLVQFLNSLKSVLNVLKDYIEPVADLWEGWAAVTLEDLTDLLNNMTEIDTEERSYLDYMFDGVENYAEGFGNLANEFRGIIAAFATGIDDGLVDSGITDGFAGMIGEMGAAFNTFVDLSEFTFAADDAIDEEVWASLEHVIWRTSRLTGMIIAQVYEAFNSTWEDQYSLFSDYSEIVQDTATSIEMIVGRFGTELDESGLLDELALTFGGLVDLADEFTEALTGSGDELDNVIEDGQTLHTEIGAASETLSMQGSSALYEIIECLTYVVETINDILSELSGSGVMTTVVDDLLLWADTIVDVLGILRNLIEAVCDVIAVIASPLLAALANVIDFVSEAANQIAELVNELTESETFTHIVEELSEAFGTLAGWIYEASTNLSGDTFETTGLAYLRKILESLLQVIEYVVEAFNDLTAAFPGEEILEGVLNVLNEVVQCIATIIAGLAEAFVESGLLETLVDIFVELGESISDLLNNFEITDDLAVDLTTIFEALFTILNAVVGVVGDVLTAVINLISNSNGLTVLVDIVSWLIGLIADLVSGLADGSGAIESFGEFFSELGTGFSTFGQTINDEFIEPISSFVEETAPNFVEVGNSILGVFESIGEAIETAVNSFLEFTGLDEVFSDIGTAISETDFVGSFSEAFSEIDDNSGIFDVLTAAVSGLDSALGSVSELLSSFFDELSIGIGYIGTGVETVFDTISGLMDGTITLSDVGKTLEDTFSGVGETLEDTFSGVGETLSNAKESVSGFFESIGDSSIADTVSGWAESIAENLGLVEEAYADTETTVVNEDGTITTTVTISDEALNSVSFVDTSEYSSVEEYLASLENEILVTENVFEALGVTLDYLGGAFESVISYVKSVIETFKESVDEIGLADTVSSMLATSWQTLKVAGNKVASKVDDLGDSFEEFISSSEILSTVGGAVNTVFTKIGETIDTVFGGIGEWIDGLFEGVETFEYVEITGALLVGDMEDTFESLGTVFDEVGESASNFVTNFVDSIQEFGVVETISDLLGDIGNDFNSAWEGIGGIIAEVITGVDTVASSIEYLSESEEEASDEGTIFSEVVTYASEAMGAVAYADTTVTYIDEDAVEDTEAVATAMEDAEEAAETLEESADIFDKIVAAIESAVDAVDDFIDAAGDTLGNVFSNIVDWASSIPDALTSVAESISEFFSGIDISVGSVFGGIADMISSILSSIWTVVSSFISGLASALSGTVGDIGTAISGGFQSLVEFILSIPENISTTLDNVQESIASGANNVGSTIGGIFSSIWDTLSTAFTNVTSGIDSFFSTFASEIAGEETSLSEAFDTIATLATNVFSFFSEDIGFDTLLDAAGIGIGLKFGTGFEELAEGLGSFFSSLNGSVSKTVTEASKDGGTLDGLSTCISKLTKAFEPLQKSTIKLSTVLGVAAAVLIIAEAINTLCEIDWKLGWMAILQVEVIMLELVSTMGIISKIEGVTTADVLMILALVIALKMVVNSIEDIVVLMQTYGADYFVAGLAIVEVIFLELASVSVIMSKNRGVYDTSTGDALVILAVALALDMVVGTLADLMELMQTYTADYFIGGLAIIEVVFLELASVIVVINKAVKESKNISSSAIVIVAVAIAMNLMASALLKLVGYTWDEMKVALGCFSVIIGELTGCMAAIMALSGKLKGNAMSTCLLIITIAGYMLTMTIVINKLTKYNWNEIGVALTGFSVIMGDLTGCMSAIMALSGKLKKVSSVVLLIIAICGYMYVMAQILGQLTQYDWNQIGVACVGISVVMGDLAGVMAVIMAMSGKLKNVGSTVLLIITILGYCILMTPVLISLSQLSWEQLAVGVVGLTAILGELVVAVLALIKVSQTIKTGGEDELYACCITMLAIATACLELSYVVGVLGGMSWNDMIEGCVGLGLMLTELVAAIVVLTKTSTGSDALELLAIAVAFVAIGYAMNDLAAVVQVFGSMSWDQLEQGLVGMGLALAELVACIEVLGLTGGAFALIGSAALYEATQGLDELVACVQAFGTMSWEEAKQGITLMGEALDEIVECFSDSSFQDIFTAEAMSTVTDSLEDLAGGVECFMALGGEDGDMQSAADAVVVMGDALAAITTALDEVDFWDNFGANAITTMVEPLGELATSVDAWTDITVPSGLQSGLETVATGVSYFNFTGWGAESISEISTSLGELATSVMAWEGVSVPNTLAGELEDLADAISCFGLDDVIAGLAIDTVAEPLQELATAMGMWAMVGTLNPDLFGEDGYIQSLADAISCFGLDTCLAALGMETVVEPLKELAYAVNEWNNVVIPEGLGEDLESLGTGISAFGADTAWEVLSGVTGTDSGSQMSTAATSLTELATAVGSWTGVSIPGNLLGEEGELAQLGVAISAFGADDAWDVLSGLTGTDSGTAMNTAATSLTELATAMTAWTGVSIPEGLGGEDGDLAQLAEGVAAWGSDDVMGDFIANCLDVDDTGASTMASIAGPLTLLATAVAAWQDVSVPEGLGGEDGDLAQLADGIAAFGSSSLWDSFVDAVGGDVSGADALSEIAEPLGTLAESVSKWAEVTVPEEFDTTMSDLATAVKEWSGANSNGAIDNLASAGPAIESLGTGIKKMTANDEEGSTSIEQVSDQLGDLMTIITEDIPTNLESSVETINGLLDELVQGFSDAEADVYIDAEAISSYVSEELMGASGDYETVGSHWMSELAEGMRYKVTNDGDWSVCNQAKEFSNDIVDAMASEDVEEAYQDIGNTYIGYIVEAFAAATLTDEEIETIDNISFTIAEGLISQANIDSFDTVGSRWAASLWDGMETALTGSEDDSESMADSLESFSWDLVCALGDDEIYEDMKGVGEQYVNNIYYAFQHMLGPNDTEVDFGAFVTVVCSELQGSIAANFTTTGATWMNKLIEGWAGMAEDPDNGLAASAKPVVEDMVDMLESEDVLDAFDDVGYDYLKAIVDKFTDDDLVFDLKSDMKSALIGIAEDISADSTSNTYTVPSYYQAVGEVMMSSVADGFETISSVSALLTAASNTMQTIAGDSGLKSDTVTGYFTFAASYLISKFGAYMSNDSAINGLVSSIDSLCDNALYNVQIDKYYDFYETGEFFSTGLANGIKSSDSKSAVVSAAASIATAALDAVDEALDENSPSKATYQMGVYFDEGLENGILDEADNVTNVASILGETTVSSLSNELESMSIQPNMETALNLTGLETSLMNYATETTSAIAASQVQSIGTMTMNALQEENLKLMSSYNELINSVNELRNDMSGYTSAVNNQETVMYVDGTKLASTIAKPMNQNLGTLSKRGRLS